MNQLARAVVALFSLVCLSGMAWAGQVGPEFQVNTYTTSFQQQSSVAGLTDNGFVVSWSSIGQDGDSFGVFAQRYDAAGNKIGGEFQVNKYVTSGQQNPSVAGLDDGGFVVAWRSDGQDGSANGIYGQRYDAAGNRVGKREFKVNRTTESGQDQPNVAALGDGGFVVLWASFGQDGSHYGVYGQRYDAAGKHAGKREFKVNKYTADGQYGPSVAGLDDGGYIAIWHSEGQDGSSTGVYGQRYDDAGKRTGKREFKVNKTTTAAQTSPSVASLADGGFVVTWESDDQDGSDFGIFGQRYDDAGKRAGNREFMVNMTTLQDQRGPSVTDLVDGGFVVGWYSIGQDGSGYGVFGQRYTAAGKRTGKREFMVNTFTGLDQAYPRVAGLGGGGFVFTWTSFDQDGDGAGIFGQRYAP